MTTKYCYEVDGKTFETLSEAEEYCAEQKISNANVTSFSEEEEEVEITEAYCKEHPEDPRCEGYKKPEEQTIEDGPEESPSDEGLTERENQGAIILEHYGEIKDETLKGMVLSTVLGQTSISDDPTVHDKHFQGRRTTENEIREHYERLVEDLQDEKSECCPLCHLAWFKLSKEYLENLNKKKFSMKKYPNQFCIGSHDWSATHGMMKGRVKQITKGSKVGIIRQIHCRSQHPEIFKTLQEAGLFQIGKSNDDKPESCSKPEELSADQSGISDNKVFLEQLSKKAEEGLDLTPEERKRMFDLWKGSKETGK